MSATEKSVFGKSELRPDVSAARVIAREHAHIIAGEIVAHRREYDGQDFTLQDGGIDLIQIMSLSMRLTELIGFQVPMNDLLSSKATMGSIAAVIDANTATGRGDGCGRESYGFERAGSFQIACP